MIPWVDFIIYAVVTAITPGPNNIMSMGNAARFGLKKSLRFNFGILCGFCIVISLCTLFTSMVSRLLPVLELPMLILGVTYILYLAWKTWKSREFFDEFQTRYGFFAGLTLQFVNPKLYLYSIVSMDAYILPLYADNFLILAYFALLLAFIGFICTILWSVFGSLFRLLFVKHAKATNTIMAILLVYCALSLVFSFLTSLNIKFFLIFATVLLVGCSYVSLRLIPRTSLSGFKKYFAYFLCYLPFINIPVRYEVRSISKVGAVVPQWLEITLFTSYILIGALSIFATIIFITDLFLLGQKIVNYFKQKNSKTSENIEIAKPKPDASRRLFLQNSLSAGIVVAGSAFVGYGLSEAMGMPEVRHVRVPINNLPPQFNSFKIVQLTDLHINRPAPISRLIKIVDKVNSLNPDVIVITGDMSDSYPSHVRVEMEPLRKLSAKHGKYFASGNHEYYTGIELWLEEINRLELTNLHNEHEVIELEGQRLLICGVPDINAPNMSNHVSNPILAQEGSKQGDIKILLAHQPQSIYEAVKANYDLQISGHTHGGQLFPWTYVTDLVQPYIHGLYKVENTQLYVSRGTGYWGPPLRIGAPAEITYLELIKA